MKTPICLSLFAYCLFLSALPASALTEFRDSFTATKLNSNWKPFSDRGGKLALGNGKLNLVISQANRNGASGALILNSPQASVKESWEMEVVVTNNTKTGEAWTGILMGNAGSIFDNNLSIELNQFEGQARITSFTAEGGEEKRVKEILTSAKNLYIRVAYDSKTKICTLYFRTKSTAKWTKLYTYSPFNGANAALRGNWGLNTNTGRFSVAIFGGSVNKINAGAVTLDNFVIKNAK